MSSQPEKSNTTPSADRRRDVQLVIGEKKGVFQTMTCIAKSPALFLDLSQPMTSGYNPSEIESNWYDWWQSQGFFLPQMATDRKPSVNDIFVIPLPPPTINGSLHIGHALTVAIEDALTRWYVLVHLCMKHCGIRNIAQESDAGKDHSFCSRVRSWWHLDGGCC
jgi:hypothetical protein